MKDYKIKEMKYGYFVGDFYPSALRSKNVEMAMKKMIKGTLDSGYFRKNDTEIIYIVSGCLEVCNKIYNKGDILVFEPEEIIHLFALETTEILIIKAPGTSGDLHRMVWEDSEQMINYYRYYLDKVKKMSVEPLAKGEAKIRSKDISVVVQGYVDEKITIHTLASIRKYLPDAKIILSTWKECNCAEMDYDILIVNEDPGACECSRWKDMKIANNGNRQILSTQTGLQYVDTKYCLKLRSDLMLLGNGFLKAFESDFARDDAYIIFEKPLIIGDLFTRDCFIYHKEGKEYNVPKPFHPSDWFVFGLTKDLKELYESTSLIPEEEMRDYKCKYSDRVVKNNYKYSWRYATEQHILLGSVRKAFPNLRFDDWTDWDEDNIRLSRNVMQSNFQILDFIRHDILNLKYIPECFANSGVSYVEQGLFSRCEFELFEE